MPVQLQQYASTVAAYRVLLYTGLSIGAVLAVVASALKRHSNFYSVAVYLSRSNGAVVVLANFGLLLALLAGRLLQQIFFGPLRAMEVERLYDRMWFFVTESLLAFTIFRDEFDIPFALMFGLLLFTKCFHWLLSDRIEWMDQRPYPGPPLLFHIRIHALIFLLWATDLVVFMLTIENMMTHGVGGTVLFASEYAILLASLGNSVAKYAIGLIDLRRASLRGGENAPPWEDKSMLIFYVELATDFIKLVTYMTFFMLVLTFYGLPLNIIRDVYITARSFVIRFRDLIRYRTATRNMDERYPNATEEELSSMSDRTCIICREEMGHPSGTPAAEGTGEQPQPTPPQEGPNTTPKKLPCGHIFHFYCLRSWLERQQSCPTCRRSVLEGNEPAQRNGPVARAPPEVPPQAPNGIAAPQPFQWQPDQQPNRGGLFGRIIGAAGMPPVGHGQFIPPPIPGQAPQPNGNLLPNQQVIPPPAYAHPLAYHRPLAARGERFAGFFGPDGVWHAWPQAAGNADDVAPNMLQPGASVPTPTSTVQANPETRVEQTPSSNSQTSSANGSAALSPSPPAPPESSSAREAVAAAAALRRLTPSNSSLPTAQSSAGSGERVPPISPETRASNGSRTNDSAPVFSRPSNTSSPPSMPRQMQAPALIPLFDPHVSSPQLISRLPRGSSGNSPYAPHQRPIRPLARNSSRLSSRELPPELTDEQLRILDQTTREAIDERLRLLENVQLMTSRCIADLLRCRSVLPRSTTGSGLTATPLDTSGGESPAAERGQAPSEANPMPDPSSSSDGTRTADNSQPPRPVGAGA